VREDTRKAYPERRFVGYNTIEGRLMVVVFCCPTLSAPTSFIQKGQRP
jgi:uncharacterized DUF497 family protein